MVEILKLMAAGGIASLDSTAAWQVLISQPIVNSVLTGFLLGDVSTGAMLGILLQIVWGGSLPVGASSFPDGAVAGVAGTGGAILLARELPGVEAAAILLWSLACALILGLAGARTIVLMRRLNERLVRRADSLAGRGNAPGIEALHVGGIGISFARGAVMTGAGLLALYYAGKAILPGLPAAFSAGFQPARILIWSLGVSVFSIVFLQGRTRTAPFVAGVAISIIVSGRHFL